MFCFDPEKKTQDILRPFRVKESFFGQATKFLFMKNWLSKSGVHFLTWPHLWRFLGIHTSKVNRKIWLHGPRAFLIGWVKLFEKVLMDQEDWSVLFQFLWWKRGKKYWRNVQYISINWYFPFKMELNFVPFRVSQTWWSLALWWAAQSHISALHSWPAPVHVSFAHAAPEKIHNMMRGFQIKLKILSMGPLGSNWF